MLDSKGSIAAAPDTPISPSLLIIVEVTVNVTLPKVSIVAGFIVVRVGTDRKKSSLCPI